MSDKARDYSRSTIRRLDTLSGGVCAAPNCDRKLIAKDKKSIISKICHIEAASENGPRYNAKMTDEERRSFENLILLCDECHTIIDNRDNERDYPVDLLRKWKLEHEENQIYRLSKNTSVLRNLINKIANINIDDHIPPNESKIFEIENKMLYNNLKRNRHIINEYKIFYYKIESLYKELELSGSRSKEKLLRNIKNIYLKVKGSYTLNSSTEIFDIRNNADSIFDEVEEMLIETCPKDGLCKEDLNYGISIIMVDAFMRCKILENPNM